MPSQDQCPSCSSPVDDGANVCPICNFPLSSSNSDAVDLNEFELGATDDTEASSSFGNPLDGLEMGDFNSGQAVGQPTPTSAENPAISPVASAYQPTRRQVVEETPEPNPWLVPAIVVGAVGLLLVVGGLVGYFVFSSPASDDAELATNTATVESSSDGEASSEPVKTEAETPVNSSSAASDTDSAQPQPAPDPAEVLANVRASTAFIRVETDRGVQTGSGFLRKGTNMLVTNAHVVIPKSGKIRKLECIFNSGTPDEVVGTGRVVGLDFDADLAHVSVYASGLPDGLDYRNSVEPYETQTVIAAGFPFGEALATSKRNPAISLTKGSISSVRRNDFEEIVLLQVDGGINPGNSGGPVITEDGKLVGVAVAKVSNSEVGFAIPSRLVKDSIRGRVAAYTVTDFPPSGDRITYAVNFALVDINRAVGAIELMVFEEKDMQRKTPTDNGDWECAADRLIDTVAVEMTDETHGKANVELPYERGKKYFFQIAMEVKRRNTRTVFTEPIEFTGTYGTEALLGEDGSLSADEDIFDKLGPNPSKIQSQKRLGESTLLTLPTEVKEFAFNPDTGDLACLAATGNFLHILRGDQFDYDVEGSFSRLELDAEPRAITFFKFGEQSFYAVACKGSTSLYLINATEFELVQKIPCSYGTYISSCAGSLNPEDPFLYYISVEKSRPELRFVDLRSMQDRGKVGDFLVSKRSCEVHPTGKYIYICDSKSSGNFVGYRLMNSFEEKEPVLSSRIGDGEFNRRVSPSLIGDLLLCGQYAYSTDLSRKLPRLAFLAESSFRTKPVVVGIRRPKYRDEIPIIFAANFNVLDKGKGIPMPREIFTTNAAYFVRSVSSQDHRRMIVADDVNERVVIVSANKVLLTPFSAFGLETERVMTLEKTDHQLIVDRSFSIPVTPVDDEVSVKLSDLPEGAAFVDGAISWTPGANDLGVHNVGVTMEHGEVTKELSLKLEVQQPHVFSPIPIKIMRIAESGRFGIVWQRPGRNWEMSIIPFVGKSDPINKPWEFGDPRDTTIVGSWLVQLAGGLTLYDPKTLEPGKKTQTTGGKAKIYAKDGQIAVESTHKTDIFSVPDLKLTATIPHQTTKDFLGVFRDGIIKDGVLYDLKSDEPKLILHPGKVTTAGAWDMNLKANSFLRMARDSSGPGDCLGPIAIPELGIQVAVRGRRNPQQETEPDVRAITLTVVHANGDEYRFPISTEFAEPQLDVKNGAVWIGTGNQIFRWNPKRNWGTPLPEEEGKPYFLGQQSSLLGSGRTVELKHQVVGGQAPYEFYIESDLAALEIEPDTGTVSFNRNRVLSAWLKSGLRVRMSREPDFGAWLKRLAVQGKPTFELRTGKRLQGLPLAVPIRVKTIDANGQQAEMQYFTYVDFPFPEVLKAGQTP